MVWCLNINGFIYVDASSLLCWLTAQIDVMIGRKRQINVSALNSPKIPNVGVYISINKVGSVSAHV